MTREELKQYLQVLHFHGYIDHDFTKLDDLLQYADQSPDKSNPLDVDI